MTFIILYLPNHVIYSNTLLMGDFNFHLNISGLAVDEFKDMLASLNCIQHVNGPRMLRVI